MGELGLGGLPNTASAKRIAQQNYQPECRKLSTKNLTKSWRLGVGKNTKCENQDGFPLQAGWNEGMSYLQYSAICALRAVWVSGVRRCLEPEFKLWTDQDSTKQHKSYTVEWGKPGKANIYGSSWADTQLWSAAVKNMQYLVEIFVLLLFISKLNLLYNLRACVHDATNCSVCSSLLKGVRWKFCVQYLYI
jgi:hypothetical protein